MAQEVETGQSLDRAIETRKAGVVPHRPLTHDEDRLLRSLLSHDFEGVEALRKQLDHALVASSCTCGCGSLGFAFAEDAEVAASSSGSPLPVEGEVLDSNGGIVGGVIVLLKSGFLDDVDVYSLTDGPLPWLRPESVRWRVR